MLFTFAADCSVLADDLERAAVSYAVAQEKVRNGATREGLADLRQLLRTAPWLSQAQWAIARAELARGNFVWAYMAFKRYTYAAAVNADDRAEAVARLKELEKKEPAFAAYAAAEEHALAKRWAKAAELARVAIDRKPKFPLAHRLLGVALASIGQDDAAVDAYSEYIALEPDAPEKVELEEFIADYRRASGT
jgi:predicted Zn-dependent protease